MPVSHLGPLAIKAARLRYTVLVLSSLLLMSLNVAAQNVDRYSDARWTQIKGALLGDVAVQDGAGVIELAMPKRAQDAAIVPVDITTHFSQTAERHIHKLYLVIDQNPSPIAAEFEFPGDRDWKRLSMRVRVNSYTHVRALAQLNTGETFMSARFEPRPTCHPRFFFEALRKLSAASSQRFSAMAIRPAR